MDIVRELSISEFNTFLAFVEDLPKLVDDIEKVALVVSGVQNVYEKSKCRKLGEEDIRRIRSLCIRLRDTINGLSNLDRSETRIKNLISKLEELLEKLEAILEAFYQEYGYLPSYSYEDRRYYQRMYGVTPFYYYYDRRFPRKEIVKLGKLGPELDEKTKDHIMEEMTLPEDKDERPIWDGPYRFKELMEYTVERLKEKTEELKKARLQLEARREQALSDKDKILSILIEKWLKAEKVSGRW